MKTCHLIAGIDPGLSGAIALFDPSTREFRDVIDMPTHEIKVNRKIKRRLDLIDLASFLDNISKELAYAVIENVSALPRQGVTSGFNFGYATGAITGIFAANFIPLHRVHPSTWKREMKLTGGKDGSRARASEMFPRSAHFWPLKKHDGRAEAALLAYYGHAFSIHFATPSLSPGETVNAPIAMPSHDAARRHGKEDPASPETPPQ
jgi:crossover junction endodeoxyribonuclease RuvC